MKLRPDEVFAGRFRVLREVAEGGVGTVYEVVQTSNQTRRALKVLHEQYARDAGVLQLFRQEAWIASKIHSPYAVQVIDARADSDQELPWILLEWLDGHDLERIVKARGRMSVREIRAIFAELGDVMGAAHGAGVVHCDLKPQNIMLAQVHQRAMVKVVDFGIARLILTSKTHATLDKPIGSPDWMAPEQVVSGAARPSSDVWAMGMIAYYLFTAHRYWHDPIHPANNELMTLLRRVVREPMDLASERARLHGAPGAIPDGFDAWFARCVDRDDRGRFSDGRAASEALLQVLKTPSTPPHLSDPQSPSGSGRRTDPTTETQRLTQGLELLEATGSPEEIVSLGEEILTYDASLTRVAAKVASASVALAWSHAHRGDLRSAIAAVSRAVELAPYDGGPWYARGVFRGRAGELEVGLEDLDRALALDARVAVYHREQGRVLHLLQRYDEALASKTRALELDGRVAEFWASRAGTRMALGDWNLAADDYARALELSGEGPRRAQVHHLRARALVAALRWSEAVMEWSEALAHAPDDGLYWYSQADALRALGDVKAAEFSLRRAARFGSAAAAADLAARS